MGSTLNDICYLTRSEHRVGALIAMTARPRSRSELGELTGASSSTIRRILRDFEERHWIHRDGYEYVTTELGSFIAESLSDLLKRFETEREIRRVWEWLPQTMDGFDLSMCVDARVTVASSADPYQPVNRFTDLLKSTETLRFVGFDVAVLEPSRATLCDRIVEGMSTELIAPPRVIRYIRTTHPDAFHEPLDSGNLTVRVHQNLPSFGIAIVDDRMAISCYDSDGVTVRILIDTERREAIEWAKSVYDRYHRETPTLAI